MTPQQLVSKVLKKDKLALARLITLLENREPKAIQQLEKLYPYAGKAIRIGITGPQGVGKSSLLNRLIQEAVDQKKKVGVLAIDPSSSLHGGAFLGDRIRMQQHTLNKKVFIRSMATRSNTKGISPALAEAAITLDAYGCDVIFIETIGIGQDEIEITKLVDLTALILSPDFGDKFQALKSGLIETCDFIVVNKLDLPKAKNALATLKEMNPVPVLGVSSKTGTGISKLFKTLLNQYNVLKEGTLLNKRREQQFKTMIHQKCEEKILNQFDLFWHSQKTKKLVEEMKQKKKTPNFIANNLIKKL